MRSLLVLLLVAGAAHAGEFEDIGAKIARGELAPAAAIAAYEALGAKRPIEQMTDDAWAEAARLAERAGDPARARRDFEQVLAIGTDPRLVDRARAGIARLGEARWDAISNEHDALVAAIGSGGDPRASLERLEAIARDHPSYPRRADLLRFAASAWEREGEIDRALADLGGEPNAYARMLVRHDRDATAAIAKLRDPTMRAILEEEAAKMVRRHWLHRLAWLALGLCALAAAWVGRRSWRRLRSPPTEVIFVAPIALVIALVAQTGNPLVARAVWIIVLAGIAIGWIAGALATTRRALIVHAAIGALAALCVVYLAVDRGSLSSMIAETLRAGPQR